MRVMIVENDQAVGDVLRDFLLVIGHQAQVVPSAEVALERLRANPPDLVLLDFRLPGTTGLDFLQHEQVRGSRIPIVAMSGIAAEGHAETSVRLGAIEFVAKPLALEHLRKILESLEPRAERRRSPRARVVLPVRVRDAQGSEWETTSVDLSAGGMKIYPEDRPHRVAVELSFIPPGAGERFEVSSLLVRVDVSGHVFHFANLTQEQLERLTLLVSRLAVPPRPE